jgi:hypothetical protein
VHVFADRDGTPTSVTFVESPTPGDA